MKEEEKKEIVYDRKATVKKIYECEKHRIQYVVLYEITNYTTRVVREYHRFVATKERATDRTFKRYSKYAYLTIEKYKELYEKKKATQKKKKKKSIKKEREKKWIIGNKCKATIFFSKKYLRELGELDTYKNENYLYTIDEMFSLYMQARQDEQQIKKREVLEQYFISNKGL